MNIEKTINAFRGEDVTVFITDNDGGELETSANFVFNFISNSFITLEVDNKDNAFSYDDIDVRKQIKDIINDSEKKYEWNETIKQKQLDITLKEHYLNKVNELMETDPKVHHLNDFESDFILHQIVENSSPQELNSLENNKNCGDFLINITSEAYDVCVMRELKKINQHNELTEKYKGKQFILIENNDDNPISTAFVKGADMSYRNNDIYVYDETSDMSKYIERINVDLQENARKGHSMTAKLINLEEMQVNHNEVLANYDMNKKLKEYKDKSFLFISNNNNYSKEIVKGLDMDYKNNDLFIYDTDSNLAYLASGINRELQFNHSSMIANVLTFSEMRNSNIDVLIENTKQEQEKIKPEQNKNKNSLKNKHK
jgi:hypothetical protein